MTPLVACLCVCLITKMHKRFVETLIMKTKERWEKKRTAEYWVGEEGGSGLTSRLAVSQGLASKASCRSGLR